jgi:hypothetical protein
MSNCIHSEDLKGRDRLCGLGAAGRNVLKWILNSIGCKVEHLIFLAQFRVH